MGSGYDTSSLRLATVDPMTQRVNITYDPSPATLAKYPPTAAQAAPGLTIIDALGNLVQCPIVAGDEPEADEPAVVIQPPVDPTR